MSGEEGTGGANKYLRKCSEDLHHFPKSWACSLFFCILRMTCHSLWCCGEVPALICSPTGVLKNISIPQRRGNELWGKTVHGLQKAYQWWQILFSAGVRQADCFGFKACDSEKDEHSTPTQSACDSLVQCIFLPQPVTRDKTIRHPPRCFHKNRTMSWNVRA